MSPPWTRPVRANVGLAPGIDSTVIAAPDLSTSAGSPLIGLASAYSCEVEPLSTNEPDGRPVEIVPVPNDTGPAVAGRKTTVPLVTNVSSCNADGPVNSRVPVPKIVSVAVCAALALAIEPVI